MPVLTVPVEPGPRRLESLVETAGEGAVAGRPDRAQGLRRLRVTHLATPPFAPRALDLLRSTIPLLRDCGLDVRCLADAGDERADAAVLEEHDPLRGGDVGPYNDVQSWR